MGFIVKLLIAGALGAGLYFVSINSHLDLFPCTVSRQDFETKAWSAPESQMCSLMYLNRDEERAELTPAGYAAAAGFLGVLPLIVVFGSAALFGRKRPKLA